MKIMKAMSGRLWKCEDSALQLYYNSSIIRLDGRVKGHLTSLWRPTGLFWPVYRCRCCLIRLVFNWPLVGTTVWLSYRDRCLTELSGPLLFDWSIGTAVVAFTHLTFLSGPLLYVGSTVIIDSNLAAISWLCVVKNGEK